MVVAIIKSEKANELKGTIYQDGIFYNPVQLPDGRWYISFPEAQYLSASEIQKIEDFIPEDEELG